jgi:S-adenosylmethionine:tRNA ribosyltransferase-isomerase
MKLSDFDYSLDPKLIAQKALKRRDASRLLIYNRATDLVEHKKFFNIIDYLRPGDLLFLNDSKVFSARLKAFKESGGKIEIFLLKALDKKKNIWQALVKGKIKEAYQLKISSDIFAKILNTKENIVEVSFNLSYFEFINKLEKLGETPLPPYIKRKQERPSDLVSYQTVYANDKKIGSAAAPTAGLHFTDDLLKKIKEKGVEIVRGTLHVGLGTFLPIKTENILDHKMHREDIEISKSNIGKVYKAKKEGRRVIAVGTTSARILESLDGYKENFSSDIFIYPPYNFKIVDALITNFHLPKSSLLMLVSAFASKDKIFSAYKQAIDKKYRFFSFGDAMFLS